MPAKKQLAATTGAALAATLMLAACSGGDEDAGGSLETISIMAPLLSSTAPDPEGEVQSAIEEYSGQDLDITWVPNSNYTDRLNVVMASDDIPHVMVVQGKTGAFTQAAEAGAYWNLTEYLDDYENLTPENEDVRLASSVNGQSYGIYRMRDAMRAAVIIRKDWLENLGLEEPQSVEDLYNLAQAFTENDPDGNGKDDTTGLIIPQWSGYGNHSPYDLIETWFGTPNRWGVDESGELYPAFEDPAFIEALNFVKDMVDNGYINSDFATMDSATWNDPFFNGEGGIIIDVSSRALQLTGLFKEQYPDTYGDYVTMVGNLEGPDGQLNAYPTSGYSGFISIPKASVQTEEQLHQVLSFLNDMSAKKGQVLLNNGIEGVNFEVQDGQAVAINADDPEVEVISNDTTAFAQIGTQSNGYLAYPAKPEGEPEQALDDRRTEMHASDLESAVYDPAAALVSETYTERGAVLDQIITDARIQYLAGQIDEEGLRAEIQRWRDQGGEQIVQEMNELYAELDN
ncbi:extracellular solute-binding protein [Georgenia halophila]|uniref:Extracellular solute-binding protein n=1 Tax=Georgenia halophila TaxID=620889 RepID=A0ABP8LDR5_9MICO